jgi:D-alanyl-D-alanine carboxypeptidase (penicillin-binding protein 5/6)
MFSFLVAITLYIALAPLSSGAETAPAAVNGLPAAGPADRLAERMFLPLSGPSDRREASAAPVKKDDSRLGVETSAKAVAVVDWLTGTPLFEKNAGDPLPIASITKLMTALVVLDREPDWNAETTYLGSDERPGGIPYLAPGERIAVGDLFNLSLVASANGATVALARSTGLSAQDFVAEMNAKAAELGMESARFADPTGLDPANVASARDVAVLIRHALDREMIHDAVMRRTYEFTALSGRPHAVRNTDELLGSFLDAEPYRFLGGKTGFLHEAGYCFGAAAENGDKGRVIAVVLGAPTKEQRFREVKSLLYWAFDAYSWPQGTASR